MAKPAKLIHIIIRSNRAARFMSPEETREMQHRLEVLRSEHRDLDDVIARLTEKDGADQLLMRRLKKRKLVLKDQISALESALVPDIIA
jgi:hypothetical protein